MTATPNALQLFPPTETKCNEFGGLRAEPPKLLQLFADAEHKCNEFGGSALDVERVEGRGSGAEVVGHHGGHDVGRE